MNLLAKYAIKLHQLNSEWLGFIPGSRIKEYAEHDQIIAEYENGELCGYLIYGIGWPYLRVYQACVEEDIRFLGHGENLVSKANAVAEKNRCGAILLGCRKTNKSLLFWSALGFRTIGERPGGKRRGIPIAVMSKPVNGQGKLFK